MTYKKSHIFKGYNLINYGKYIQPQNHRHQGNDDRRLPTSFIISLFNPFLNPRNYYLLSWKISLHFQYIYIFKSWNMYSLFGLASSTHNYFGIQPNVSISMSLLFIAKRFSIAEFCCRWVIHSLVNQQVDCV